MREIMQKFALVGAICLGALTGAAATGKTEAFPVDLREGGRVSAGSEELTFSNLWDGDEEATVTIAQDGAAIFTGLSGEGVKKWMVDRNGRYELTHTTYANGVAGKVETAVFVVEGKEVPVSELTIDWGQKSFVYDGQPKEPVITVKDRETTLTKGTHYLVEYKDNINVGTAKAIVKGIEPYVEEVTNEFAIVKGSLPPGDDPDPSDPGVDPDDPAQREDPTIHFSAFDYVGVYDGEVHTIDTNALKAAYAEKLGAGVACMYARAQDGEWMAEPIAIRDVGVTSFWYKVTSANYDDFVRPCKVVVTNRLVTLTSGTKTDFAYDGKPHAYTNLSVTAGSFAAGEGIATSNWATVTTVAEGEVDNAFDYALIAGTRLENYALTIVTGKIAVVKGSLPSGDDPDPSDPSVDPDDPAQREDPTIRFSAFDYVGMYDGEAHTIDTNALMAAYAEKLGAGVACMYARAQDGEWMAEPIAIRDVGVTSFWYKVTSANYEDFMRPCKVVVTNRYVTLTSGTKTDFAYDGKAHAYTNLTITAGSFAAGEGIATSNWATVTAVTEGEVANAFDYAPIAGMRLENYALTIVTGKIAVVKGSLPPGDDPDPSDPGVDPDDPTQREDPTIPFSAFDFVGVYDGEAHTIDTNALRAAYEAVVGEGCAVSYAVGESGGLIEPALPWMDEPIAIKDVGVTSFWYKVTSVNYEDFVRPCKVVVTNRPVTVTSGTKLDFAYDGKPHAFTNLTVTAGSFAAGEGIVTSNWATVTAVAEGEVDNAFDYAPMAGTKLENYALTVMTGKIAVVAPTKTVKVELDALGGRVQGKTVVTQTVAGVYGELPSAVRENYRFDGWYLGVEESAPRAETGAEVLVSGAHTLFARWTVDPFVGSDPRQIYTWEVIDEHTVRITGLRNPQVQRKKLVLPERIDGRFVTELAAGAFANVECGVEELTLPMFCTKIGDKVFTGVKTLKRVTFATVRKWDDPRAAATMTIGSYAFSGTTALTSITLPNTVAVIGNYAFLNARNLASITILGRPTVGAQVFRSAGMDYGGVVVHIDPALAAEVAYMEQIRAGLNNVTVITDAVVSGMEMAAMAMSGKALRLTVEVERAADWGEVNTGTIRVRYQQTLSEPGIELRPTAAIMNGDGTIEIEVELPEGESGFIQTTIK